MVRYFIIISCFSFLSLSCAPELNDVVEDWKKEGWTIVRTHGVKQDLTEQER